MHCHELDGVSRFAGRALRYASARPSYPGDAIAAILARVSTRKPLIVDVGAGTGISTSLFTSAGRAFGIDPSFEMIMAGPRFDALLAKAEQLPLFQSSVDIVSSFNAFHWFQSAAFLSEARRVLKPGGTLALVWNDWNHDDPFTHTFVELMRSEAGDHPPENRASEVAPLYESALFPSVVALEFPNQHLLNAAQLRMRLQSMSYIPGDGPRWERLSLELDSLFERFKDGKGFVNHHYTTTVFLARPALHS